MTVADGLQMFWMGQEELNKPSHQTTFINCHIELKQCDVALSYHIKMYKTRIMKNDNEETTKCRSDRCWEDWNL